MDNIGGVSLPEVAQIAMLPSRLRSRLTNSLHALPGVDGRSVDARRFRDLAMAFADELGGAAALGDAEQALIRQAAAMVLQAEKLQGAAVRGEDIDLEQMTRLSNAATRALTRLGVKRRTPADTTPTIAEIAARHRVAAE